MSGQRLHLTEILASRKAEVEHGQVILPVLARGEWVGLVATPATWRGIFENLTGVIAPGKLTTPVICSLSERRKIYARLFDEYIGGGQTIEGIARREGINSWTLRSAFRAMRAEREARVRKPIEKPSGGIL